MLGRGASSEYGIVGNVETSAVRPHAQSVEPGAYRRRLVGRIGGGGGGGHRADGACVGRARIDPHPGRLLRPGRDEADPRPRAEPARRVRLCDGLLRRSRRHAQRARQRRDARRDRAFRSRARPMRCRPRQGRMLDEVGPQRRQAAHRLVARDAIGRADRSRSAGGARTDRRDAGGAGPRRARGGPRRRSPRDRAGARAGLGRQLRRRHAPRDRRASGASRARTSWSR